MKNLFFLGLLAPTFAFGISIKFTAKGQCAASDQCKELLEKAAQDANADLPSVSADAYAEGISNSVSVANKGSGSDYSDNFNLFVLKGAVGFGVQSKDTSLKDTDKLEGVGIGAAATVGVNLDLLPIDRIGPVDFSKLDLFISGMKYGVDTKADDFQFDGDIASFGIFARYRLVDAVDIAPGYMLEWGGLHLHTGFQRSSMDLGLSQKIKGGGDYTTDEGNEGNIEYDTTVKFDIESAVSSIPIELSTYVRAAYIFTLYGGAGFDINMGKTDIELGAFGDLTGTVEHITGDIGDVEANGGGSGKPEATNFRAFGGVQFNLPFVRLYAQVNKPLGTDVLGANLGLKVLW